MGWRSLFAALIVAVSSCVVPKAALLVRVEPSFRAGCLKLHLEDLDDPSRAVDREQPNAPPSTTALGVPIFPDEGWGARIRVTARAYEANCQGAKVAEASTEVSLP